MSTPAALPVYLDAMLTAWRSGRASRAVHFGYWATPPRPGDLRAPGAFFQAQARLDALVLGLANVAPGRRVLDIGCGLGGTLEALDRSTQGLAMTGVNLDARQLAACRSLQARPGNSLSWVQADACALPFEAAAFEHVLCVEAVFHFRSRTAFLDEAARVLVPGGSLVLTDLRARRGAHDAASRLADEQLAIDVAAAFGPWPEFWCAGDGPPHRGCGLERAERLDISLQTLPTHTFTAPPKAPPGDPLARACRALAQLHREGRLEVVVERYVRV